MASADAAIHQVVHVLPDLAVGGGQRLIQWMSELDAQPSSPWRHRALALAGGPLASAFEDGQLRVITDGTTNDRAMAAIADMTPSIVHVHTPEQWRLARAVRRELGVPVVSTFHGLTEPTPSVKAALADRRLLSQVARVPVRRLRFVRSGCTHTAVSGAAAQLHAAAIGLDARHLPVVNPGLPARTFESVTDRLRTRQEWAVHADAPVVTAVGSLTEAKGATDLPSLLQQLVLAHPTAVLVVAGSGPARTDVEEDIHRLGLAGSVRFVGQVDDVASVLDAGDLHLTTSRSESFGLGVLEAMARLKPVVGYHTPGFDDFFVPGAGQLINGFDPAELGPVLAEWAGDPQRAEQAGRIGGARSLDFPIEATRVGFEAVYERAISESGIKRWSKVRER